MNRIRILICLVLTAGAYAVTFDTEIQKSPPPFQGVDFSDLTDAQREELSSYWENLNERLVEAMKRIHVPIRKTGAALLAEEAEIRRQVRSDIEQQKINSRRVQEKSLSDPEVIPLEKTDAERTAWSMEIVAEVNPHFSKPYADFPDELRCSTDGVVNRPNHSLAHGMRQAYLAVDIAIALSHARALTVGTSPRGAALRDWVQGKLNTDPQFRQKLQFTNAFQRSGRQSDIAKDADEAKYLRYLENDQENFQAAAEKRLGTLFGDQREIDVFKKAITEKFGVDTQLSDLVMLSKIFYTAHTLDLRRIPRFDKKTILKNVALQLFEKEILLPTEQEIVDKLWDRSGNYLSATGDRDMESTEKSDYDRPVFCAQAHNPRLMIAALEQARSRSETMLTSSMVATIDTTRDLKMICAQAKEPGFVAPTAAIKFYVENICSTMTPEIISPFPATDIEKEQIASLRSTLKTAPYTASEAYLKIDLGDKYIEIPPDYSEEMARALTTKNVVAFLAQKKRPGNLPRIANPDAHYIYTLVDCLMAERQHRDKIALYHTTEPEMGFFADVYSQKRNQLSLAGGRDITALRVLDTGFLKLDTDTAKAHMGDFMKAFEGVADSYQDYRDLVLSTNFSLFGSDQQINADTYNMFYEVKHRKVVTQALDYGKFLNFVEQYTGIPGNYEEYKAVMDRFVLNCQDGPCRNGRLIQVFVDPEVLVKVGYFSVLMGAPVLKSGLIPSLDEPIKLLRTNPAALAGYLADTKGAHLADVPTRNLRPGPLLLHDLQVRLFMRPEVMVNPDLIQIKSYWRFYQPRQQEYLSSILKIVNNNLSRWIESGMPARDDAFAPETNKLKKYAQYVYQGTTGRSAPSQGAQSLEDQLVALLINGQDDAAAALLTEHFQDFQSAQFQLPPSRNEPLAEKLTLSELIQNYRRPSTVAAAFALGIFPGGDLTNKFWQRLDSFNQMQFLHELPNFPEPHTTAKVVEERVSDTDADVLMNFFRAISDTGNNIELLEASAPLLKFFGEYLGKEILFGVQKIAEPDRAIVIGSTIAYVESLHLPTWGLGQVGRNLEWVLPMMLSLQPLPAAHREQLLRFTSLFTSPTDWYIRAGLVKQFLHLSTDTLARVEANLKARKEFPGIMQHSRNRDAWLEGLAVADQTASTELKKCPNKAYFRAVLTEYRNYPEDLKKIVFDDDGASWVASDFTAYQGTIQEIYPLLSTLKLVYNTSSGDGWCLAQFYAGAGTNKLTIHLNRQNVRVK